VSFEVTFEGVKWWWDQCQRFDWEEGLHFSKDGSWSTWRATNRKEMSQRLAL